MLSLVIAALLFGAEDVEVTKAVDAPARGSVGGPWALLDLSFLSAVQAPYGGAVLGGELALVGGIGFEIAGVRFSPTARFAIGPLRGFGGSSFSSDLVTVAWSPLALAIAAPDLINDTKVTGLRLTPVFGVTVPTTPRAFDGTVPFTNVSIAAQLERRFGILELRYRLEGNTEPCLTGRTVRVGQVTLPLGCPPSWSVINRVFGEAWLSHSVSVALGVGWFEHRVWAGESDLGLR